MTCLQIRDDLNQSPPVQSALTMLPLTRFIDQPNYNDEKMRNGKRIMTLAVSSLLMSGCATTEIINQIPVPQIQTADLGQIKVCREKIFYGDAAATITSVDRRPILRSSAGKCFSAKVAPGSHVLSVITQGPAGLDIREHDFTLQKGLTKYFKTEFEKIYEVTSNEFSEFSDYEWFVVQ